MASLNYLREQFKKLQTEEERSLFCYKIYDAEYWSHSGEEKDSLPETFSKRLFKNLHDALAAEGRVDLYDRFVEVLHKVIRDREKQ